MTQTKSDLDKKINDAEQKIPDTSRLVKNIDYNFKMTEYKLENDILRISGLATNSELTGIEDKMLVVSSEKQILMKKLAK